MLCLWYLPFQGRSLLCHHKVWTLLRTVDAHEGWARNLSKVVERSKSSIFDDEDQCWKCIFLIMVPFSFWRKQPSNQDVKTFEWIELCPFGLPGIQKLKLPYIAVFVPWRINFVSTDQPTDLQAVHYSTLKLSHFTLVFFLKMPLSFKIISWVVLM